jgi:hypothetical protein
MNIVLIILTGLDRTAQSFDNQTENLCQTRVIFEGRITPVRVPVKTVVVRVIHSLVLAIGTIELDVHAGNTNVLKIIVSMTF